MLSALNDIAPPGELMRALAAHDPFAVVVGPAAGVDRWRTRRSSATPGVTRARGERRAGPRQRVRLRRRGLRLGRGRPDSS